MRIPFICLVTAGALALGGCGYNGLGVGLGYGSPYGGYGGYGYDPYYDGYGYGSRYGGYGSRYAGYGYGGYGGYGGFGYGYQPFGWYDGFYYPGTGYYVYDTYRRPRIWSDAQRAYWVKRISAAPATRTPTATPRPTSPNWSGFEDRRARVIANRTARQERMQESRSDRRERIEQRRIERRPMTSSSTSTRTREGRRSRRDD